MREIFPIEPGIGDRRLPVDLAGERQIGRPKMPAIRPHNRTPTVHRDNRVDSCAAPENERRAADPVFRTFSFPSQAGAMPTPVALTATVVLWLCILLPVSAQQAGKMRLVGVLLDQHSGRSGTGPAALE